MKAWTDWEYKDFIKDETPFSWSLEPDGDIYNTQLNILSDSELEALKREYFEAGRRDAHPHHLPEGFIEIKFQHRDIEDYEKEKAGI